MIRVHVHRWGREHVFESDKPDLSVGAGEGDDLRLDPREASIGHLRLSRRRGAVLVQPMRPAWVGAQPVVGVPVVLGEDADVRVGNYRLKARPIDPDDAGFTGRATVWGTLEHEVGGRELGVRRYLSATHEVSVAESGQDGAAWLERLAPHFEGEGDPHGGGLGRPAFASALPPGRPASELLGAGQAVRPPPEAAHALAMRLAERLAELHRAGFVHGGLWPDRIWLTRNGDALLLPPGPDPDVEEPLTETYFPSHRRAGGPPTADADVWAVQVFMKHWLEDAPPARRVETWSERLRAHANARGLDPVAHHIARWVRLLDARAGGQVEP